jgi:acyl-homoserine-lactone acylase
MHSRTRLALLPLLFVLTAAAPGELQQWRKQADRVTITRDDWGIAHIHGKTDADAVFGMIYAQAEDDFPRIETNYLMNLGRTGRSGRRGKRSGRICGHAFTSARASYGPIMPPVRIG